MNKLLDIIEERLRSGSWFRRGIAISVLILTFRLTAWGTLFAEKALIDKVDLMAVAAIIGAVAGIPVALLTLLLNKYVENQNNTYKETNVPSQPNN